MASIEIFFKEHGFTFLERVSNIKVLDEIMNENPHKHNKYIYNQAHRCFKGIVLAKVNDRHHLFGLIEVYRTYLLKTASDEAQPRRRGAKALRHRRGELHGRLA